MSTKKENPAQPSLKERMMNALRATGHVSEAVLEAVATVAIETATGLGESER